MFIATLFIITKTQKQPRCPSIEEWINKLLHPYNGILLSTKRKLATKAQKDTEKLPMHIAK